MDVLIKFLSPLGDILIIPLKSAWGHYNTTNILAVAAMCHKAGGPSRLPFSQEVRWAAMVALLLP